MGCIEHGEKAKQMVYIVNANSIDVDRIMATFTTLYMNAACTFGIRLNAWQHLSIMNGVGIAQ